MEARGFAVFSPPGGCCRRSGLPSAARPSRAPLVVRSVLAQRRLDRNSSSVVKLAATSRTEDPVARRCDAGADVEAYVASLTQTFREIRLPLNGSLVRQEGSFGAEWKIVVPRLSFFDVWIQPVGMCQARSTKDSVLLEANHQGCTLMGSDAIHSLRLNDRFTLEHVHVSFRAKKPQASVGVPKLCIAFDMSVLVDVPPPFSFMPRHVVEATGQSGLQASFNVVMRSVASSMAKDYQQWAVDPAHRSKLGRVLVAS